MKYVKRKKKKKKKRKQEKVLKIKRNKLRKRIEWEVSKYVNLAIVVEGDQKASFSIATTPRGRGGRHFFPWIAPFYPRYVPYIAEC